GFALLAILALGIGIGASTTIFGVVDAVLLAPLPYPEPERLAAGYLVEDRQSPFSGADFADLAGQGAPVPLAGYRGTSFNTIGAEGPERIDGAIVTRSFFDILGRGPALGRTLARAGGDREVVLSDAVWRRRFDGARDVLGRTLVLDAETYSIV